MVLHESTACSILEVSGTAPSSDSFPEALTTAAASGTPGDYNQWKALGNDGWGYDDLEQYFVKSETACSHPVTSFRSHKGMSDISLGSMAVESMGTTILRDVGK